MFPSCHRLIAVGLNLLSYKTIQNHTTFNTNTDTIPHRRRVEFNICHKASVTDSQDCRDENFSGILKRWRLLLEILEVEVAIQMVVEVVVEAKKLDKVLVAATLDKDKWMVLEPVYMLEELLERGIGRWWCAPQDTTVETQATLIAITQEHKLGQERNKHCTGWSWYRCRTQRNT